MSNIFTSLGNILGITKPTPQTQQPAPATQQPSLVTPKAQQNTSQSFTNLSEYLKNITSQMNNPRVAAPAPRSGAPSKSSRAPAGASSSNPYEQDAQSIYKQLQQTMQTIQPQEQEYMQLLINNNKAYLNALKSASEVLQKMPDAPVMASYSKIVQDNSNLMPIMSTIISLGTAIFGNKSGITLSDKFSNMFAALKDKNLQDYEIARQQSLDDLNKWKADIQLKFDKLNSAVNLAMQGKNANDQIISAGLSNLNNNLQNNIALFKMLSDASYKLEDLKVNMAKASAEIQRAASYGGFVNAYGANVASEITHRQNQDIREYISSITKSATPGEGGAGGTASPKKYKEQQSSVNPDTATQSLMSGMDWGK